MKMYLTCASCGREWTVLRWSPAAMRCPKCHGERLSEGIGGVVTNKERELAAANQKESARLLRVAEHAKTPH